MSYPTCGNCNELLSQLLDHDPQTAELPNLDRECPSCGITEHDWAEWSSTLSRHRALFGSIAATEMPESATDETLDNIYTQVIDASGATQLLEGLAQLPHPCLPESAAGLEAIHQQVVESDWGELGVCLRAGLGPVAAPNDLDIVPALDPAIAETFADLSPKSAPGWIWPRIQEHIRTQPTSHQRPVAVPPQRRRLARWRTVALAAALLLSVFLFPRLWPDVVTDSGHNTSFRPAAPLPQPITVVFRNVSTPLAASPAQILEGISHANR